MACRSFLSARWSPHQVYRMTRNSSPTMGMLSGFEMRSQIFSMEDPV